MRYINEAPKGVMDVLFLHLIQYAKEKIFLPLTWECVHYPMLGKTALAFLMKN